jgi:Eco57I restriction-modification methylase
MESIARKQFNRYIENFEFDHLFNQLGWDYVDQSFPKKAADSTFQFQNIADKAGFVILICQPDEEGKIPDAQTRKRIHIEIAKLHHEHLIIFIDKNKSIQQWELLVREPNKPTRTVSHKWIKGQAPELLYQKLSGAFFSIEEDELGSLTIIDVVQRIKENFGANADKVTKAFYTEFKKQHTEFLDFIEGIEDTIPDKENTNKQWYASLMLNRLMFCYFIQKKGFLDQNKNYLQNKLTACTALTGKGKFYSFYRSFLLELFHDGLGKPINKRCEELPVDLGKIPYLNGGLFDVHELELQFDKIKIDDNAFERIFTFFDKWEWHLDTREHAEGKTINPDVIGYIFEKYINDRASMGAYYTKEDITDYIGKNTIIPFLFDETERNYKQGFKTDSNLWISFKQSGDTYIYDAVKKGVPQKGGLFDDLPDKIQTGLKSDLENEIITESGNSHLWETRKVWNTKAPEKIALPTEIYRELIERRKRYANIKSKVEDGKINHINDFITYNLNIRQFTQDYIETTEDPVFIRHFYRALNKITILDPTCGSGAFLFAALNILEPLYETCIKRMVEFTDEQPGKHKFFEETLAEIQSDKHPNLQYFIFKSIILNNLFGVDIMHEAVEIAKLRLFLKLVATVDVDPTKDNFGLEPLPDVDFNIRAGNTLIGFATETELLQTIQKTEPLFAQEKLDTFKEEFELVSKAFGHFQNAQLINDQGSDSFKTAKAELNQRLKELNHKLNVYLATNYGIDAELKPTDFENWLTTHLPFHWFAEFYRIVSGNGGFDCVIGNPPYVEYSKIKKVYIIHNYDTLECGNIYAPVIERSTTLISDTGMCSMIIPSASVCTPRMSKLMDMEHNKYKGIWISNWDERPGKLFGEVDQQLSIHILKKNQRNRFFFLTTMNHWNSDERRNIFPCIQYYENSRTKLIAGTHPKISSSIESSTLTKSFISNKTTLPLLQSGAKLANLYYRNAGGRYWKLVKSFPAYYKKQGEITISSTEKLTYVDVDKIGAIVSIFSSSMFYFYWRVVSNCRHLTNRELNNFPIEIQCLNNMKVKDLSKLYEEDLKTNAIREVIKDNEQDIFYTKKSKPIIDQIDTVLAKHYGFTEEELDFIINYDIKYRMGKALFGEENGGDEE